jgi:heme oxygenase
LKDLPGQFSYPTPKVSPCEELKKACAAAQEATVRIPLLAGLASGELAGPDYALAMGGVAALFQAVLVRIRKVRDGRRMMALTDLADRTDRVRADARFLGVADKPDGPSIMFIRDRGSALGALYVLERSRFAVAAAGAKLLQSGRAAASPGYSFFDLRMDGVEEGWRTFKVHLDRGLTSAADLDQAVRGVRGVFGLAATIFGRVGPAGLTETSAIPPSAPTVAQPGDRVGSSRRP